MLGHDYGEWTVTTKPTCLEAGEETSVCKNCGDKQTTEIPATNHSLGDPVVVQEPTISNPGIVHRTCANCGDVFEETIPCAAKDEATGIDMVPGEKAFPEDTELSIAPIPEGDKLNDLGKSLKGISGNILAYEITASSGGTEVQPNGAVKTTFPIPAGMDPAKAALYYVAADGTLEKLDAVTDAENGTLTAELSRFGTLVIAEEGVGVKTGVSFLWWILLIVLAVAVCVYVYARRKKHAKQAN